MPRGTLTPRTLGTLCESLFLISTAFPITASVYRAEIPRWIGFADVVVAGLLLVASIALAVHTQYQVSDADKIAAFRISQLLISAVPALLIVFFAAGHRIHWDVLVVGLAWRGWLLIYSLPYLITARRTVSQVGPP